MRRILFLDLASGIMTVWVLYFHALYPIFDGKILNNIPYLYFFMPWFFYKSGMMFSPKPAQIEWKNGMKKLIKTFVIWSVIGYVAYVIWHWCNNDMSLRIAFYSPLRSLFLKCSIPLNGAVWFLPILFIVRQIGNCLLKYLNAALIVFVTLCLCVIFRILDIPHLPTWISATTWGLFFFSFAYLIKKHEANKWLAIFASIVYFASVFTPIGYVYGGGAPLWSRILYYPSCAFACIFFNNVCKWIINLTGLLQKGNIKWQFPVLTYIGENAMNFYVPHYILFKLTFDIMAKYSDVWYSGWQGVVIITLVYALMGLTTFVFKSGRVFRL